LAGDLSESRNLVSQQPEKLKELVNRYLAMESQMPEPIELPRR
jgi:hypothetical protein